ncbi:MAG TPA: zinc ribbon domain-containing protein [Candidatus Hydrogenedentes bacterium]|nr:zinc ribbon domain-containing protein [Candidatus Hydrogenedentota bacterium]HRT20002.1 zinc ribbon domain-containing protein [Candidatus Hydrogenedentota bacterium]HRT64680.1 zinc ribbon domain-containing protein [Candidatus Hydrogenedentota bacterium]
MPLFRFVCEDCGQDREILVRGQESPACPNCGSPRLIKQASAFAPAARGGDSGGAMPPGCESCCSRRDGTCPKF